MATKRLTLQHPDHFWVDLAEEIQGLRDVIESSLGEADEEAAPTTDNARLEPPDDGVQVLGLVGSNWPAVPRPLTTSKALLHDSTMVRQLCQVFLQQVDPIIKILHRPSLSRWMINGERYLAYPEGHRSIEALGSAVCYSAISSMTENQCRVMFQTNKASLVAESRASCEIAIGRSGLLTTRDITVLQAFVLYLMARRVEDRTWAVWTLVAVAVRIGKGLGLYLDRKTETFFDQQMRKRLWYTICLMDLQASFFRTSEPLISVDESASTTLPQHINDSDFDPTTTDTVPDREGLTDTTFALVTYHAQRIGRLLNFAAHDRKVQHNRYTSASSSPTSGPKCDPDQQQQEQQKVRGFEQEALRLLHFCDPEASVHAWFTWHGTQSLIAAARLAALRPLQWPGRAPPPRMESNSEILRLTLPVLEKVQLMHTDARGEGFRWYVTIPWHALAIAVSECYVSNDSALIRRAWPLVESSYRQHEVTLAGSHGGALRGPLRQLTQRTREKIALTVPEMAGGLSTATSHPTNISLSPAASPGLPGRSQTLNRQNFNLPGCQVSPSGSLAGPVVEGSPLLDLPPWDFMSQALDDPALFAAAPGTPAVADGLNQGADTTWEELFSGIPFNEIAGPDWFFFEMNQGVSMM
ncbi:Zn(II)2Cys6 domain-containing transcription factor nscR [Aspergillus clavatus NRRL 1]|uniref:C6 transcription factor, putative n=1 Tax=Aspergillus clavatus (strain ATCC 1007 / CBS 513.65 / DSM 816 / NCTC 3887 / NRRL 1 / QM 1276 / 107) TaxID=344612 RepID=A1CSV6_ASPCL|nr:C6 transcription factor, putative [Aspergillus clavatus NRRL 1]EAW06393.1 C6 transcription factor, putative [Aspergillus clavatus NRRL 1]